MFNWRKPIIGAALRLSKRPVLKYFKFLKSIEYNSPDELQQVQDDLLKRLLLHAYNNVHYYHHVLAEAEVVKNRKVRLENFLNVPVLTKEIIRKQGHKLYSQDYNKRSSYHNSSGGSTGEPVDLLQDKNYQAWGLAGRVLYNLWVGKSIGDSELKLWGSERDILLGKDKPSIRLRRWLFNTEILNAYKMSDEQMRQHIDRWNQVKPKMVWAYTDSMYRLSKFVQKEKLDVYAPASIICTTAPLLHQAREHIERNFGCKVFNQYGSREVGTIACECENQEGLHIFTPLQKIEILDSSLQPVEGENTGEIIITNLTNYSMPLVRYKIGDTGSFLNKQCTCGRAFPLLKDVSGRSFAHFVKKDGGMVHAQFFVGLFFFKTWVREFKVVQKNYDLIEILVALEKEADTNDIDIIRNKIQQVMGKDCQVNFKFVDEVPPTASGKYLYTVSEVYQNN